MVEKNGKMWFDICKKKTDKMWFNIFKTKL